MMSSHPNIPSGTGCDAGASSGAIVADETSTDDDMSEIHVPAEIKRPLTEVVGKAAVFSYAGLCAVSLASLFPEDCNKEFNQNTIRALIKHLHLDSHIEYTLQVYLHGEGLDQISAFSETLFEDGTIQKHSLIIPSDLIAMSLQTGVYDCRMRTLVQHVSWHLRVIDEDLERFEQSLVLMLKECQQSDEHKKEMAKASKKKKLKRYALIGLATVGGGALLGLTGGLAAPFIAAGAAAVIGGSSAAVLGSITGLAIISSLFGVTGAGLTGYKMNKRVGALELFCFTPLSSTTDLRVTIAISGWLQDEEDNFHFPWITLDHCKEQYSLNWEPKSLINLGKAMDYILTGAMSYAAQEALRYTILSGLLAALTWPVSLLSIAAVIDNPWGVAMTRAAATGKQLADVLLSKQQGGRPVTLIGFSLGAKVIFSCLQEMCKRKSCEGIIEEVILLGAPVSGDAHDWEKFSRVVSGRIVNGYCRSDWLLKFVYRTSSMQFTIAGLEPVTWDDRRMCNIDLTDIVKGHMDYKSRIDVVLNAVGVKTKDSSFRNRLEKLNLLPSGQSSPLTSTLNSPVTNNSPVKINTLNPEAGVDTFEFQLDSGIDPGEDPTEIDPVVDTTGIDPVVDTTGMGDVEACSDTDTQSLIYSNPPGVTEHGNLQPDDANLNVPKMI